MLKLSPIPFSTTSLCIFVITLLFSCSESNEVPENILQPEKMVAVLTDFQIAESALTIIQQNGMDVEIYKNVFYEKIFMKHKINKQDYINSMNYYSVNLKLLDKIYEEVITELNKRQISLSASN
ncbi:MAG: DUF4296 domain-containing protein [Bacteroidales bacterium]|nr:DUF4296 domain-containing protein [Bacteroidales bacterium]